MLISQLELLNKYKCNSYNWSIVLECLALKIKSDIALGFYEPKSSQVFGTTIFPFLNHARNSESVV